MQDRDNHKKRVYCIYKKCKVFDDKVSTFRVPNDDTRCRQWLLACGRQDLLNRNFDASKAYNIYRVCSAHFAPHMFVNFEFRTRLLPTAVPEFYTEPESDNLVSNDKEKPGPSQIHILESSHDITEKNFKPPNTSSVETQTPKYLIRTLTESLRTQLKLVKKQNNIMKRELVSALKKLDQPDQNKRSTQAIPSLFSVEEARPVETLKLKQKNEEDHKLVDHVVFEIKNQADSDFSEEYHGTSIRQEDEDEIEEKFHSNDNRNYNVKLLNIDEFEIYGRYLASQLSQLNHSDAQEVQIKINALLMKFKMKHN